MQASLAGGGSSTSVATEPRAAQVSFSDGALVLGLSDGRTLSVPLEWFPRLRDASADQRKNWRLISRGYGIHWPDLDVDVCVPSLLGLPD
jgi:hypothetical protein